MRRLVRIFRVLVATLFISEMKQLIILNLYVITAMATMLMSSFLFLAFSIIFRIALPPQQNSHNFFLPLSHVQFNLLLKWLWTCNSALVLILWLRYLSQEWWSLCLIIFSMTRANSILMPTINCLTIWKFITFWKSLSGSLCKKSRFIVVFFLIFHTRYIHSFLHLYACSGYSVQTTKLLKRYRVCLKSSTFDVYIFRIYNFIVDFQN